MSPHRDRAALITTTILAIVTNALRQWLHEDSPGSLHDARPAIEAFIRDELAE